MGARYYSDGVPRLAPIDRRIVALALPALGALIAEPAFLLVDTALVGHLGVNELAGIGIGQAVLQTVTGLLVFLAYATTPRVARFLGAGRMPDAVRAGIDGMWLALAAGLVLQVLLPLAHPLVSVFGAERAVTDIGSSYLAISILGLPGMLIMLAATGLLRGLQDTKTPLIISAAGFGTNAALNVLFIYGMGMGVPGSALGTVIAQWGMAFAMIWIAVRQARKHDVSLAPHWSGMLASAGFGGWLFLRTLALRLGLLSTTFVATSAGTEVLAATQVAFALWSTLAFALDALAIAAQAMIGKALGAGDVAELRLVTRRLLWWGLWSGVVVGALFALASPVIGRVFTSEPEVLALLPWALLVVGLAQPLAGLVFVLDGILIGAGDARYLAWTGFVNLLVYLPLLLLALLQTSSLAALVVVWLAFGVGYMGARLATLYLRARTDRWMVLGAD
ncbi:MAG: MATE family efflux transporter [Agrococcus casei]|uniref:MATE family efflux transporter n=1 Tax=Agrococcus casei TaxID=343512 RepID=UPI003F9796BF